MTTPPDRTAGRTATSHDAIALGIALGTVITALLRAEQVERVQRATSSRDHIARVESIDDLLHQISREMVGAVMLDPSLVDRERPSTLAAHLERIGASVIIYGAPSPGAVQAVAALARRVDVSVVIESEDDTSDLRSTIAGVPQTRLVSFVLAALDPALRQMPDLLRTNIIAMFTRGLEHASACALARSSAMTRRSLGRWLVRTGIRSAHLLVASARLCAASSLLLHSNASLARVAGLLGYGDTRGLDRHCRLLLGMDASTARRSLQENLMASLICSRLLCRRMDDA